MRKTRLAMLQSVVALILCAAMLVGTTFAWFTDEVASAVNKIQAGNLDVDLVDAAGNSLEGTSLTFMDVTGNTDILWEPGCTFKTQGFRVANRGSLALEYTMYINGLLGDSKLLEAIDFSVQDADGYTVDIDTFEGQLSPKASSDVFYLVGHMDENAGNEYMNLTLTGIGITVYATQAMEESDAFGPEYDKDAFFPGLDAPILGTVDITTVNDLLTADAVIVADGAKVTIPAGTRVEPGTTTLKLRVKLLEETSSNVQLGVNEVLQPMDVTVEGISEDNHQPLTVELSEIAPVGLNMGSIALHHVHDGTTVTMTRVAADAAFTADNQYRYDPATGDLALHMATFSEVAVVADTENAWEGNVDHSWYDADATELTIANADQLWSFSQIVGGMNGKTQDSFKGKTVKLIADINLGDKESENNPNIIFYPIGYYNSEGTYERTNTAIASGLRNFEGTFDGNGHTVSNFYQNTWEMKGDHDWYSPEEQYYRDGMGLFGRVYSGTVKNLTIENFSSDGEITTTGCVAAYADGATFENIAIFNCNPRVYNIGNGGIVGCVGWYAKDAGLKTTFTNITVDNSNKISALWGSYDVACGGIVGQYYPTSGQSSVNYPKNAGVEFTNCHVSAVMDVYNDVCANYQYYAYRYTGMLIGSVRENETIDGHVYPKMDGITAKDCTVHFGDWNDYYYCEIIDNTTASYTHDYQMSRLTEIKAIDGTTITYLDGTTGTVPASGRANYVIVDYTKGHGTENATCYHFKDGAVWTHDMGGIQTGIDENGDGQDDLKEDKQHIYLEFNNLVTGYGWGVTSRGFSNLDGVTNLDITQGDHENSVEKFEGKVDALTTDREYTIGEIFMLIEDCNVKVIDGAVSVTITNLDENGDVIATFTRGEKWSEGTISFENTGNIAITIQDYYFCTATTINVSITERAAEEKFDVVMNNGDFLHRVGNVGTVALGKLFAAKSGASIGTVSVKVEPVNGTAASGTYTSNATWTNGTIQFSGTGVVKVTITDNEYCTPTELYLEVVDATNVTGLSGTISGNVVLLNDCGLSSLTVSGRNTVYGNGFTATYTGNGQYLNNGLKQGVVTVSENGTLDNLRIEAPVYPKAYLYYGATMLGDYVQGGPSTVEGSKTRYHYQLSAVVAKGNATISNCYIYGGRTNIFVDTGDVTIEDTILECGTVANVQLQSTSEYTVTLEDVTTIQYQINATIDDTSKVMLGAGVLVGPDTNSNPTIVLNGDFKQYNWVTKEDANAVSSSTAQMIINGALDATNFNHTINGKTASNLGIIYMNTAKAEVENNTDSPYKLDRVTMTALNQEVEGQAYSLQGATASQIYSDYVNADRATVNGDYLPTFKFDLGDQGISYDGSEDTRYLYGDADVVYALYQDGDAAITLDLTKLATIYKYSGTSYTVTAACKDSAGKALAATNGVVTLSAQGSYTLVFTAEDNLFYDANGKEIDKSVTRTFTVPLEVTVKEAAIKNAVVNITKTALDGEYNTVNINDYELRIKFLECISITDYDNKGTGTTVNLSSNISSATLTPSGVNVFTTAFTVTITYTDGRVLTVNFSKISGSSPGTKTGKVNTSGSVYFTTEGALNNKPTEASSQNKCTITSVSFKGNSGSTVTNDTGVTVTWALGSSSGSDGCVTPDTLITLADGTQVRVDSLTGNEELLVWNMETGKLDSAPILFVDSDPETEYEIIHLYFSDGTDVKVISEHGFWDYDLNQYVYLDRNAADYIGHTFAKQNGDILEKVVLVDVVIEREVTTAWSPVTAGHLCYFVNGMLSMPGGVGGLFNIFEVNAETMTYDYEQMAMDIETYGLYTYEELNAICPLSEEMFNAAGGAYLKVSIGKGNLTEAELIAMILRYSKYF